MEKDKLKTLGKLLVEKTTEGMKAVAERHGLLVDGRIDLRGARVRFNHSGLDFTQFLLEGADLTGSRLMNCSGEGASFAKCTLAKFVLHAEKGKKVSFRGASFDGATIDHADIGPRTLDLTATTYRGATLNEVTFMLPKLEGADFTDATISDCYFRTGILRNVSFRNAKMTRVSLEYATLEGADFTGASFDQMEYWGEPNYEGAIITDELRYQYGEVKEPAHRVDSLIARGILGPEATAALRRLKARHADLLSYPECMLIAYEMEDIIPKNLFVPILKALKDDSLFAN